MIPIIEHFATLTCTRIISSDSLKKIKSNISGSTITHWFLKVKQIFSTESLET